MPPPEVWGPAVWLLFHTLAEKINVNAYPVVFPSLFNMIIQISKNLPCPECASDASNFLARVKVSDLKSKENLKGMLYVFHNMVNAKKRKPIFHYSNIGFYGKYNLIKVINNFISQYQTKGNMKLLTESFQRQFVINNFKVWFQKFYKAFVQPISVPAVVEETPKDEPLEELTISNVEECVLEDSLSEPIEEERVLEEPLEELKISNVEEEPVLQDESHSEPIEEDMKHVEEEPVLEEPQEEVTILNIEEPVLEDSLSEPIEEDVKHVEEDMKHVEEERVLEEPQEQVTISNIEEPVLEDSLSEPIEEAVARLEDYEESPDSSTHEESSTSKKSKKSKKNKNKK